MATFYSNLYAYDAASATYNLTEPVGKRTGDSIWIRAVNTCSAALATNDINRICVIPYNCKIMAINIIGEDWGTTVTTDITLTDGSTTTDLKTGIALGTAGVVALTYSECTGAGVLIAPVTAAAGALLFFEHTSVSTPTAGKITETWINIAQA